MQLQIVYADITTGSYTVCTDMLRVHRVYEFCGTLVFLSCSNRTEVSEQGSRVPASNESTIDQVFSVPSLWTCQRYCSLPRSPEAYHVVIPCQCVCNKTRNGTEQKMLTKHGTELRSRHEAHLRTHGPWSYTHANCSCTRARREKLADRFAHSFSWKRLGSRLHHTSAYQN